MGISKIPRKIHQMWLDKKEENNLGPPDSYRHYAPYIDSWKEMHPDWTYIFWNKKRIDRLFQKLEKLDPHAKKWKETFDRLQFHIEKCDFARYAILYFHGGVYADLDFRCHQSLDSFIDQDLDSDQKNHLERDGLILVSEPKGHLLENSSLTPVSNAIMMSRRRHRFWARLMDDIGETYQPNGEVVMNTGPGKLAEMAEKEQMPLTDHCLFIPIDKFGGSSCPLSIKPYTSTLWNEGTNWGLEIRGISPTFFRVYPYLLFFVFLIALIVFLLVKRF